MSSRAWLGLALLVTAIAGCGDAPPAAPVPFLVAPYLQVTEAAADDPHLELLWHAEDTDADWSVEWRLKEQTDWQRSQPPTFRRIAVSRVEPHRVYRAVVGPVPPGTDALYRVRLGGEIVFGATAHARPARGSSQRIAIFGDAAAGSRPQQEIAAQIGMSHPDYVVNVGDLAYNNGTIRDYRARVFPIYNAATIDPKIGAPLLRSMIWLPIVGNHDTIFSHLGTYSDGLAYFLYWSVPQNGPEIAIGGVGSPRLAGPEANQRAFLEAAGPAFPRAGNYSIDMGDIHWVCIDANLYVDCNDERLRAWIEHDLEAAQGAAWRFVALHQPPFHSSRQHFNEQQARLLAPLFEKHHVDVVFAGHIHNYQRSVPLRFEPRGGRDFRGRVAGEFTLDKAYDGQENAHPDGIIYFVTGAGGNRLYDPGQEDKPETWQEYTARFIAKEYSFTLVDAGRAKLVIRQLAPDGRELDRITIAR